MLQTSHVAESMDWYFSWPKVMLCIVAIRLQELLTCNSPRQTAIF